MFRFLKKKTGIDNDLHQFQTVFKSKHATRDHHLSCELQPAKRAPAIKSSEWGVGFDHATILFLWLAGRLDVWVSPEGGLDHCV